MTKPNLFHSRHLPFIILIGIMLLCVPTAPMIDALALRPNYSLAQLLSEAWRLLSGHLIHAGWEHLFVNLVNVILLRFIFIEWMSPKSFIAFIAFSALFISFGLWILTNLTSYVGFSGIFHGLLFYLLLLNWRASPLIFSIALICILGKIIYEQLYGASPMLVDFIGVGVAIDAHALGVASGLIFYVIALILKNKKQ